MMPSTARQAFLKVFQGHHRYDFDPGVEPKEEPFSDFHDL
jgi:hypothetical protein